MDYDIRDLMQLIVTEDGAAVHLYVGEPPIFEIARQLHRVEGPSLEKDDPQRMLHDIASTEEMRDFESFGLASFDYEFAEGERFHVMAFRESGRTRLELRRFVDKDKNDAG